MHYTYKGSDQEAQFTRHMQQAVSKGEFLDFVWKLAKNLTEWLLLR